MGEPACPSIRSDETSRGAARCAATRAAEHRRTGMNTVTPCSSMSSRHLCGSKAGIVTVVAPSQIEADERRHAGHVEHRGRREKDVVAAERAGDGLVERVGDEVAVGEDHPLRPARRSAGVEQGRDRVLVHTGLGRRIARTARSFS